MYANRCVFDRQMDQKLLSNLQTEEAHLLLPRLLWRITPLRLSHCHLINHNRNCRLNFHRRNFATLFIK